MIPPFFLSHIRAPSFPPFQKSLHGWHIMCIKQQNSNFNSPWNLHIKEMCKAVNEFWKMCLRCTWSEWISSCILYTPISVFCLYFSRRVYILGEAVVSEHKRGWKFGREGGWIRCLFLSCEMYHYTLQPGSIMVGSNGRKVSSGIRPETLSLMTFRATLLDKFYVCVVW